MQEKYLRLTLNERRSIEQALKSGLSLKETARQLGRNTSTLSREIRRNSRAEKTGGGGEPFNNCIHKSDCDESRLCVDHPDCRRDRCVSCELCFHVCGKYGRVSCEKLNRPPYVCNACRERRKCTLEKFVYKAPKAHRTYLDVLVNSRNGIAMDKEEIARIDNIVSPLLKQGQSPYHICLTHKDELMIDPKTLYKYISANIFGATSFDLAHKVKMRPRKKKPGIKIERGCYEGRTYRAYIDYMEEHPDVRAVQMDSVVGAKAGAGNVLLTMHFPQSMLMLAFLRDANTARSVKEVFDTLRAKLGVDDDGEDVFAKLFPLILTDRGSEFSAPTALETDADGVIGGTRIFYCDPNAPWQKAEIENNHTFIRKILPKGTSFDDLTQENVDLMMNHINSYRRKGLGGKSPIEAFVCFFGEAIAKKLGLKLIPHDEITLTPKLFNK
jgi:IS30 family transposase